ncbi:MAG: hypothetical protein R2688_09595 [Fimbriimonadaceae bacterium]
MGDIPEAIKAAEAFIKLKANRVSKFARFPRSSQRKLQMLVFSLLSRNPIRSPKPVT